MPVGTYVSVQTKVSGLSSRVHDDIYAIEIGRLAEIILEMQVYIVKTKRKYKYMESKVYACFPAATLLGTGDHGTHLK